ASDRPSVVLLALLLLPLAFLLVPRVLRPGFLVSLLARSLGRRDRALRLLLYDGLPRFQHVGVLVIRLPVEPVVEQVVHLRKLATGELALDGLALEVPLAHRLEIEQRALHDARARANERQGLILHAAIERAQRPAIGRDNQRDRHVTHLIDRGARRQHACVRPCLALALDRDADDQRARLERPAGRFRDTHGKPPDLVLPVGRLVFLLLDDLWVGFQNTALRLLRLPCREHQLIVGYERQ